MEQRIENDEVEINLGELLGVIFSKFLIIMLVAIVGAALALIFTKILVTPKYKSVTKVYILSKQDSSVITNSDMQMGTLLTKDYKELITSRSVTDQVIQNLDLNMTNEELAKSISVESPSDSRILEISVVHPSPAEAQKIADAVREISSERIMDVMGLEAVNLVDTANYPKSPSSPNTLKNVVLGGIIGFVLAIGVVVLVFVLDDRIRTPEDVEKHLGSSVLGMLPLADENQNKKTNKKPAGRKKAAH